MLTDEPLRLGSALDENRISSTLWPTFMSLFIFIDSFHISDTFGFLFFGCFFFYLWAMQIIGSGVKKKSTNILECT